MWLWCPHLVEQEYGSLPCLPKVRCVRFEQVLPSPGHILPGRLLAMRKKTKKVEAGEDDPD
jgi:hypothetical protein